LPCTELQWQEAITVRGLKRRRREGDNPWSAWVREVSAQGARATWKGRPADMLGGQHELAPHGELMVTHGGVPTVTLPTAAPTVESGSRGGLCQGRDRSARPSAKEVTSKGV